MAVPQLREQNANKLGQNLYWRAIVNSSPDFFDLLISDGDAAVRPIATPMRGAHETISIRQAVNEDVASRRYT